jgi:hypothetical protein
MGERETAVQFVVKHIKWIMLVSGLVTCTTVVAVFAPGAVMRFIFGDSPAGPVAEIVSRSWGALVALTGAMLVYGAFRPVHRSLVLLVTAVSKGVLVLLLLTAGAPYFSNAFPTVLVDGLWVVLFTMYLVGVRSDRMEV